MNQEDARAGVAPPPGFAFAHALEVRWRDLDLLGHVNNAMYLTYLESARIAFYRQILGASAQAIPWVLAEVRCRFLSPILVDERVVVSLAVRHVGRSSLVTAFAMHARSQEQARLVAEGEAVQVHVAADTGRPAPIPPAARERLAARLRD